MKRLLIAPVLALSLLSAGAFAAPNNAAATIAQPKHEATKVRQVMVYRCWAYDNHNRWWYGQHQRLDYARSFAMTACRTNNDVYSTCAHWDRPCEVLTVY